MATNNIEKQSFGEAGLIYLKDNSVAVTGEFCAITSLDDATYFSAITCAELAQGSSSGASNYVANSDTLAHSSATIPKGITIYGQITSVTLGAGRVIIYKSA